MFTVTLILVIAIAITLFCQEYHQKHGLLYSVIFLVIAFGIRYRYGNDFAMYEATFNTIKDYPFFNFQAGGIHFEWGWKLLCKLFIPFGFQTMIVFLTAVQFGTMAWLIKKYVPQQYVWMVWAIYLFSSGMCITQLSMLRQSLAMSVVAWAIPWLFRHCYVRFCIMVLIAATFHTSAYFCFVFLFLPLVTKFNPRVLAIGIIILYIFMTGSGEFFKGVLSQVYSTDAFERYEEYTRSTKDRGGVLAAGLGLTSIFMFVFFLFLTLVMLKKTEGIGRTFILFMIFPFVITPIAQALPVAGRLSLYPEMLGYVGMYWVIKESRKDLVTLGFLGAYILFELVGYYYFFQSDTYAKYFSTYTTIFS